MIDHPLRAFAYVTDENNLITARNSLFTVDTVNINHIQLCSSGHLGCDYVVIR